MSMDKFQKALIHLLSNEGIFYASLVMQMRVTDGKDLPKDALAAVSVSNGRIHLYIDPARLEKFSVEQVARILEHECLPAGTFLTGVNKPIEEIQVGDKVLDSEGKMTLVKHLMKRKYTGEMYTIKAGMIPEFSATYNHPLLVAEYERYSYRKSKGAFISHKRRFSEPKWLRADELKGCTSKKGQYLLVPKYEKRDYPDTVDLTPFIKKDNRCVKNFDLNLDEELAFVLGFYTAEGSYSEDKSGSVLMSFTCHKEKDIPSIKRIRDLFEKNEYATRVYETGQVANVRSNSSVLGRAFQEWCGSGAANKKIPNFILFNKNEKLIRSFLDGFLKGDGCVYKDRKILNTISETLAYQLQSAILNFGESAGVFVKKDNTSPLCSKASPLFTVEWRKRSYSTVRDLGAHYGLPIRSVTHRPYDGDVYNIETESHTYTIQNIVSHNCLHLVLEHIGRMDNRHPYVWNIATDLAVNSLIPHMDMGLLAGKEPFSDFVPKKSADFYYALLRNKFDMKEVTFNADGSVTVKDGKTGKTETLYPTGDHKDWEKTTGGAADALTKEVIKQAVAEAASQARQAGKWPAGLKEIIDELLGKETINWKQLLRQYIGNKVRSGSKRSWKRESKRFGVLQKGKLKSRMIRLGIAIDTSGSVSASELQEFMSEIQGIMGSYKTDITIVECDAAVQKVYTLKKHMKVDPKFAGRGGTDFRPIFEHFTSNKIKRPELCIVFTDGEGPAPETEPIKTLWVLTSNAHVKEMPFGRTLQITKEGKKGKGW